MKNLLKVIYTQDQPVFSSMPEYIGKTFDEITSLHSDYKIIPYISKGEETLLLEIRLENSTLSCIIKDNICIEAYQFLD